MRAQVPDYLIQFLQNGAFFVSAVVMCIIATPWFGLGMIPLAVIFFLIGSYFRRSIREMKRIEAVSRSPIYSSFTEALNGVSTIRAFSVRAVHVFANGKKKKKMCLGFVVRTRGCVCVSLCVCVGWLV